MTEDVSYRVKEIIIEHMDVDVEKVVEKASIIEDLGADSLDPVELIMAFEEEFDVEIYDDVAVTLLTVEDIIKYICKVKGGGETIQPQKTLKKSKVQHELLEKIDAGKNRILEKILNSALYQEFYLNFELNETDVSKIFNTIIGDKRIDFHSTIPVFKDKINIYTHVLLLSQNKIYQFNFNKKSITHTMYSTNEFDLMWDFTFDDTSRIKKIIMTVILPNSQKLISKNIETFMFSKPEAINMAIKFLKRFSKNN